MGGSDDSRRILIVEDNEDISTILQFTLQREGFDVHACSEGEAAAQFVRDNPPADLALLDIMLPFRDGYALIKVIRESASWKDVPIIMLTALSQEKNVVRALEAGANDYLVKPFQPQALVARVKRMLGT